MSDPKVVSLSAFNAESILSHFGGRGVLPDLDANCIRALYNHTHDENQELVDGEKPVNLSKRSIGNTLNKIGDRYQIFKDHVDEWLVTGAKRDAMALAVIFDSDLYSIFPFSYNQEQERVGPGGLFDANIAQSAKILLDEVCWVNAKGSVDNLAVILEKISPEARILSQICLFSDLKKRLEDEEDLSYEELYELVHEDLATSFVVADLETDLGVELNELALYVRAHVLSYCERNGYPNPETPNSSPDLRLV